MSQKQCHKKEVLKVAHDKFTWNDGEIPYIGRYSGIEWNTFGLRNFDARMDHYTQCKWRSKRLGSDQSRALLS